MARAETEDYRQYFSRIRPIYNRLFGIAHAVTGSCDQAEYAVQSAMLECRDLADGSVGNHVFRESLRASVLSAALRAVDSDEEAEFDWNGLPAVNDPIAAQIAQKSPENQRMLVLKYGCGLSARRVAHICDTDTRHVKSVFRRFEARMRRKLPDLPRRGFDARATRAVNAALDTPNASVPDIGGAFRAFRSDACAQPLPSRAASKIFRGVAVAVLTVMCVAAFWLAAVLLQPPVIEAENSTPIEEITASD